MTRSCYQLSIKLLIDKLLIGSFDYHSTIDKTTHYQLLIRGLTYQYLISNMIWEDEVNKHGDRLGDCGDARRSDKACERECGRG